MGKEKVMGWGPGPVKFRAGERKWAEKRSQERLFNRRVGGQTEHLVDGWI